MRKGQVIKSKQQIQGEVAKLLKKANKDFPGISELLEVYGDYEKAALEFKQYLEMTQPQPIITTSNQSCPAR